jgi:DNA-binding transcriptional LysR family regulator
VYWHALGVELRQLQYFVAVADELHFRRAAERLHVSQPPLSVQIRKLESELGVELFVRNRRGVSLTAAGRSLLVDARVLLDQVDRSAHRARRAADEEAGELRIGFVGSAIYALVPQALRAFRAERPRVEITLRELGGELQLEEIARDRLDVGFLRTPAACAGVRIERLLDEPLFVVLPAAHPLAAAPQLSLDQLGAEPLVLFPRVQAPGFYDELIVAIRRSGATPTIAQEAPETQTIVALVAAGIGVSVVPASTRLLARPDVVYRPLRTKLVAGLAMAYRHGERSSVVKRFLDAARVAKCTELQARS